MKTKQKALVITIIAVMALAIIGLTIGLVLVAQQATLNNSMTVSYTANNVDATITASAMNYANATGTSDSDKVITIGDDNLETSTITFDAAQSEATGSLKFNDTDMTAVGRLAYKFTIKNTANANNTKVLKFAAEFPSASLVEDNNVNIYMGLSETALKPITRNDLDRFYVSEVGGGQTETTVYAVISVDDATIDIDNLELSLNITLEYATEGNITKNVTTNIINESNIPSVIEAGNFGDLFNQDGVLNFIEYTYSSTYGSNFSKTHNPNGGDVGQDFLVVSLNYRIFGAPANYTFTYSNAEGEQQSVTKYFNGRYFEYDDATDEFNTNYIVLNYGSFYLGSDAGPLTSMEDFNIADGTTITITITPAPAESLIVNVINESSIASTIIESEIDGSVVTGAIYSSITHGTSRTIAYNPIRVNIDDVVSMHVEYRITGAAANYTVDIKTPSGKTYSTTCAFDGQYFANTEWQIITDFRNRIMIYASDSDTTATFGVGLSAFQCSNWERGTEITITITPAA